MASLQRAAARRGPFHVLPFLGAFPIACFSLAVFTDLAYLRSENLMWLNFSSWLLVFGLVGGVLSGIGWLAGMALGWWRGGWGMALMALAVLVLAFLNSLVHAGDGWTAVVPWGLTLSALTVLAMIVGAVLDRNG